jgi:tetratricopeptide (TPR) repeat protein
MAWAWREASLEPTRWGSLGAALVLLLFLGVVTIGVRGPWPPWRLVMVAALAGFVAWNFLSMTWADFPGDAWTGADKSLIYAASFLVFALWPWNERAVDTVLALFALGIALVGAVTLARSALSEFPTQFLQDGRFASPTQYANANAALWMSGFWPAVSLALRRDIAPAARGLFLAGATVLLALAVLAQSRGWLFLLPAAVALFLLLARQRLRALVALALAAAATGAILPQLLAVFQRYEEGRPIEPALDRAALLVLVASVAAGAAGAVWAIVDRRLDVSADTRKALGAAVALVATAVVAAAAVTFVLALDRPRDWASERWEDFTRGYTTGSSGSRFTGSLGTDRYQQWTIAWEEFVDHPAIGIGSDNFAAPYLLRRGDNLHEPLHPHSTPLRLLSQLGVIGTALFALFAIPAVVYGLARRRASGPAAGGAIGAALTVFGCWLLHGSFDVFWEIPALAAPAFGLLGLAGAAVGPIEASGSNRWRRPLIRRLALGGAIVLLAASLVSLCLPWFASRYVRAAADIWPTDAPEAYERLDRAADLDPFSGDPSLLAGSIALRLGDLDRAEAALLQALDREPKSWYPYLQLGLVAEARGNRVEGLAWVRRALDLNPQDPLLQIVARLLSHGSDVDADLVNTLYERNINKQSVLYIVDNFLPEHLGLFTEEDS